VKSGSTTITIVHGLQKYYNYNGNVAPELHAIPIVEIQPEATWKWEKISIATDVMVWTEFVNNPQNSGQPLVLGIAANPMKENVEIPKIMYLPYYCQGHVCMRAKDST
jgi:hypothetical protein